MAFTADESHSACWKLRNLIYFHCDLSTPAMSTDSSQVGVTLFPSVNYFLSFYLSMFSFYINIINIEVFPPHVGPYQLKTCHEGGIVCKSCLCCLLSSHRCSSVRCCSFVTSFYTFLFVSLCEFRNNTKFVWSRSLTPTWELFLQDAALFQSLVVE